MAQPDIRTLGALRESGYRYRSVKDELRENLIARLRDETPLWPDLVGYQTTVIPQLVNGLLARHDILLLGLRGQAKTRILRSLPDLLDEWIPVVGASELWDDPLEPRLASGQRIVERDGDDTAIEWVHRSERYHEKLATPDVTIADLIGEVDLVKHAEGRHLSDEGTMHFGLVPRSNRGLFALNELPDLAPRIQVGLFNVLQERDVQIRGYPIRLHLDTVMLFSANPEDYTNRGRIVTPLKDRIGTVIRTHYPFSLDEAIRITAANADLTRPEGHPQVQVPYFVHQVVEEVVRLARNSPHVAQQSGVSVRTSIAALEVVVANAERRALLHNANTIVPRVSDLDNLMPACRGKIELLLSEDEEAEDKLVKALIGEAVRNIASEYLEMHDLDPVVAAFAEGQQNVEVGDDVSSADVLSRTEPLSPLHTLAEGVCRRSDQMSAGETVAAQEHMASAIEFILEALHVNDRLSKYLFRDRTFYKGS